MQSSNGSRRGGTFLESYWLDYVVIPYRIVPAYLGNTMNIAVHGITLSRMLIFACLKVFLI